MIGACQLDKLSARKAGSFSVLLDLCSNTSPVAESYKSSTSLLNQSIFTEGLSMSQVSSLKSRIVCRRLMYRPGRGTW